MLNVVIALLLADTKSGKPVLTNKVLQQGLRCQVIDFASNWRKIDWLKNVSTGNEPNVFNQACLYQNVFTAETVYVAKKRRDNR